MRTSPFAALTISTPSSGYLLLTSTLERVARTEAGAQRIYVLLLEALGAPHPHRFLEALAGDDACDRRNDPEAHDARCDVHPGLRAGYGRQGQVVHLGRGLGDLFHEERIE